MNEAINAYLFKAQQSLLGAGSEFANARYNNCANRSYYACFQAAIYALLKHKIVITLPHKWKHEYVKSQFVLQFIERRKVYNSRFRNSLENLAARRETADYEVGLITEAQARRYLDVARDFLAEVTGEEVRLDVH
ncbi:HEPN domain-containing protein [Kitasatospora sp. NPDC048194]|uniref:HEPN domain-containing protein n=1 Tax=Kitasatospora sp. NPDC048194 TaxID=3364045 RepID=UPI00371BEF62